MQIRGARTLKMFTKFENLISNRYKNTYEISIFIELADDENGVILSVLCATVNDTLVYFLFFGFDRLTT